MVMAAFDARMVGRGLSALGSGGGFATTCGAAASGDKSFAEGAFPFVGMTTGGCSPSVGACPSECGEVDDGQGTGKFEPEALDNALIMAWRWLGRCMR